ncbi:McrC family protein, partial [Malaciobacter marinus]
ENPLKNYQFIKAPFQKDLIKFIYSSLKFLKKKRLDIFEENARDEYKEILKILNKINNLLIKISTHKNISSDNISKKTLDKFFRKYKNNIEIKKNKKVFNLVHSIFFTELKKDVQLFLSVDLTKVFEKVLEKKLSHYDKLLYIGNESEQKIVKSDGSIDKNINNSNFLLEEGKTKLINQYPDFMIKEENHFHIIDAKYKFKENVLKKSDDIRQVLVYSLLFNKDMFFAKNEDMQKIKKIILYVQKSNININNFNDLVINIERIDIDNLLDSFSYKENLFNTEVIISPIEVLK